MALRSVEYSSRVVYCISLGTLRKKNAFSDSEGGRRFNGPFDPYRSLSGLTLRRILLTGRILHLIRDTWKKNAFSDSEGARRCNGPFDLYRSLSGITLRRVLLTDGILHLIRDT